VTLRAALNPFDVGVIERDAGDGDIGLRSELPQVRFFQLCAQWSAAGIGLDLAIRCAQWPTLDGAHGQHQDLVLGACGECFELRNLLRIEAVGDEDDGARCRFFR
jgi:hypothetical protein